MAFLLTTGPADQALEWTDLTADQRSTIKSQYSAAGISLIVTAFGTTEERKSTPLNLFILLLEGTDRHSQPPLLA